MVKKKGVVKQPWKEDLYRGIKKYFSEKTHLEKLALFFNLGIGYIFICIIKPEWIMPWYRGIIISGVIFLINSFFLISLDFLYEGKKIFDVKYDSEIFKLKYLTIHFVLAVALISTFKFFEMGGLYFKPINIQLELEHFFFACYLIFFLFGIFFIFWRILIGGIINLVKLLTKRIRKK